MRKTKICQGCNAEFLEFQVIEGKKRSLSARKFCLVCSPYGSYAQTRKPVVEGKRQCIRCLDWKALEEYQLRGTRSNYLRSCCRICEGQRITEHGQKLKARAVAYLGGACHICGYSKCMRSLTFHHRNPEKKEFAIADFKSRKWESIQPELDKCDLLCANCHGEIHEADLIKASQKSPKP